MPPLPQTFHCGGSKPPPYDVIPLYHKSAEKARVIFRLRRSDIVASDSDMKAYGFRDILFAKNSRSEYHLGVAQISLLAISLAKGE